MQQLEQAVAADRRGIPRPRRQAPRTRRSPHELTAKHYLSEPEQLEEVTLKKRKLQLKDRMEDIFAGADRQTHLRTAARQLRRLDIRRRTRLRRFDASAARRLPLACASIPRVSPSSAARWRWPCWPARSALAACRSRSCCSARSSLFFFRDPERRVPAAAADNVVLSPADGRVLVAGAGGGRARAAGRRGGRSASSCRRWTCT